MRTEQAKKVLKFMCDEIIEAATHSLTPDEFEDLVRVIDILKVRKSL